MSLIHQVQQLLVVDHNKFILSKVNSVPAFAGTFLYLKNKAGFFMSLLNTTTSFGSVSKFFHWIVFILLFFMIIFGYFLDDVPKDYQGVAYNIHKLTGLLILVLMVLRGVWALFNAKPELPRDYPRWQQLAARASHSLLYLLVIAMPLAGWIGASAAGRPPHLGDWKIIFPAIPQDKTLVEAAFNVHGILAIAIIVLVAIHILAALYHHFILQDNVLRRMWPGTNAY